MIFITVGSQKFQFNRLLKAIDELNLQEDVFAQIGYSDYKPINYSYKDFLDREEFAEIMDKTDIVITHGGTGVIISAVKKGKKVIAIPRLARYGEHVDDHQLQLIEQFTQQNLICGIQACEEIENALNVVRNIEYQNYISSTYKIIESIENFIEG